MIYRQKTHTRVPLARLTHSSPSPNTHRAIPVGKFSLLDHLFYNALQRPMATTKRFIKRQLKRWIRHSRICIFMYGTGACVTAKEDHETRNARKNARDTQHRNSLVLRDLFLFQIHTADITTRYAILNCMARALRPLHGNMFSKRIFSPLFRGVRVLGCPWIDAVHAGKESRTQTLGFSVR